MFIKNNLAITTKPPANFAAVIFAAVIFAAVIFAAVIFRKVNKDSAILQIRVLRDYGKKQARRQPYGTLVVNTSPLPYGHMVQ